MYEPGKIGEPVVLDEVSVAKAVIDGLSVDPTDTLADEYKWLVEQFEDEQRKVVEYWVESVQMWV